MEVQMAPRSRISIAKPDIVKTMSEMKRQVFTRGELDQILSENRDFWRLAKSTTTHSFIDYLLRNTELKLHRFGFPKRPTNRYAWGEVPIMEIVQSLQPDGYFTHFTALFLHGLTEQIPKTIYLNFEQPARSGGGTLAQAGINRAFAAKCRVSNNVAEFHQQKVCMLNGGNTGRLGVTELQTIGNGTVRVTNIERTLIDIAVRPIYSGGVHEVARGYESAHSQFSVNKLVSYLKSIGYTYPYHQAIGYYLDRTGKYSETQISLLRQFEMEFDFYLTHQLKDTEYVKEWRLFVPKGF